jgi:hypothetical protein
MIAKTAEDGTLKVLNAWASNVATIGEFIGNLGQPNFWSCSQSLFTTGGQPGRNLPDP